MPNWGDSIKRLVRIAQDRIHGVSGDMADHASDWKAQLSAAMEETGSRLRRLATEDEREILQNSPVLSQLRLEAEQIDVDSDTLLLMNRPNIRPVVLGAVLAGSGSATGAADELLSKLTRHVFDGDRLVGGLGSDLMDALVGEDVVGATNRLMDTVPGSGVIGGGWVHRVQHGHDLEAVLDVWSEHGSGGGIAALYHIYGRDFFTPAGIPILPVGNEEVYTFLTENLGMNSVQAADLLSVNFVELLSGFVTIVGIIRLWRALDLFRKDRQVAKLLQNTVEALALDDHVSAIAYLDQALSIKPADPGLTFSLATTYQRAGQQLNAHMAYRDVVTRLSGPKEPALLLGGTSISIRGLAAIGALSTVDSLARDEAYKNQWRKHVQELGRAGITAFRYLASRLNRRGRVKPFKGLTVLPARSLSAAANYYLAGQLAARSLFLRDRESLLESIGSQFNDALLSLEVSPSFKNVSGEIRAIRRLGNAQLTPIKAA